MAALKLTNLGETSTTDKATIKVAHIDWLIQNGRLELADNDPDRITQASFKQYVRATLSRLHTSA